MKKETKKHLKIVHTEGRDKLRKILVVHLFIAKGKDISKSIEEYSLNMQPLFSRLPDHCIGLIMPQKDMDTWLEILDVS